MDGGACWAAVHGVAKSWTPQGSPASSSVWREDPGLLARPKLLSRVQHFATPWTVAQQAPPSMGFSRQEYWSELPFPSPEDLPHPGIDAI